MVAKLPAAGDYSTKPGTLGQFEQGLRMTLEYGIIAVWRSGVKGTGSRLSANDGRAIGSIDARFQARAR